MDNQVTIFGEANTEDLYTKKQNLLAIIFIIVIILFFGGTMYIWSRNTPTGKTFPPDSFYEEDAPVSTPVTQVEPTPDNPSLKEVTFTLPGGGDASFQIKLNVPNDITETNTARNGINPPKYLVENNEFSLQFSIPSEAFETHFDKKIELGMLTNIGSNVYRVSSPAMEANRMVYSNDSHLIDGTECTIATDNSVPCGYPLLKINSGSFNIVCVDKQGIGFSICDSIIKSIKLEVI